MKIAIVQLNPTVGDILGNARKNMAAFEKACSLGPDLVIGTELGLLGYPPKDLLWRPDLIRLQTQVMHSMHKIVQSRGKGFIVGVALASGQANWLYNAAVLLGDKRMPGTYKTCLPAYDVFDESRYFLSRQQGPIRLHEFLGRLFPMIICEDLWGGE